MTQVDSKLQIPATLEQQAKGVAVRPVDYQTVDVGIHLNEGLMVFLEEYYDAISARLEQQGASGAPFTAEQLRRYVVTLIHSRVSYARRDRGRILDYRDRVAVPAFLSFVLSGIGRVELPELGVELVPKFEIDQEGLMTKDEALSFSNRLREVSNLGFELAMGYSRDVNGALDLMVLQLVEGQVVSHTDKGHPAYAIGAYFLGLLQVVNLLGPRVLYGTRDQMRMILRMVATE